MDGGRRRRRRDLHVFNFKTGEGGETFVYLVV